MAKEERRRIEPALGVDEIIHETFVLAYRNRTKIILLGFTIFFLEFLVRAYFVGFEDAAGTQNATDSHGGGWMAGLPSDANRPLLARLFRVSVFLYAVAVMVQLAYDAKLDRRTSIVSYFSAALFSLPTIVVFDFLINAPASLGSYAVLMAAFANAPTELLSVLLLFAIFWIQAVFHVVLPVVVIERKSFEALRRSSSLTKGYRWPILGLIIILFVLFVIATAIITLVVAFFSVIFWDFPQPGVVPAILYRAIISIIVSIISGLMGVSLALVYIRLLEIKENTQRHVEL